MKRLVIFECAAIGFLSATIYLVLGGFTSEGTDILVMYTLFMFGTIGYLRPLFSRKYGRRKDDN